MLSQNAGPVSWAPYSRQDSSCSPVFFDLGSEGLPTPSPQAGTLLSFSLYGGLVAPFHHSLSPLALSPLLSNWMTFFIAVQAPHCSVPKPFIEVHTGCHKCYPGTPLQEPCSASVPRWRLLEHPGDLGICPPFNCLLRKVPPNFWVWRQWPSFINRMYAQICA